MAFRGQYEHTLDSKDRLTVPARFQPLADKPRMPTAAERAVDRSLARVWIEEVDQLGGQDWYVLGPHVRQCGHLR